ncbi:MAG: TadE/TadG family type IV pilus assembly protein [Rhizobiaceae bacterium]
MNQLPTTYVRRYLDDRRGNFSLMFAGATVALLLAAGVAVDFSRAVSNQSTARNAMDAAILATARQLSLGNITADQAYDFLKTYLEGTLDDEVGPGREYQIVNFSIDPVAEKISADLKSDMPLTFMTLAGLRSKTITSGSTAVYGVDETEVVMTFDVTGSMKGSKIADLRRAAASGIDELLSGAAENSGKLRIGIVPYAEGVNTGPLYETVFVETKDSSGPPPKDTDPIAASAAADNCSTERKGSGQFTDDSPRVGKVNRDFRLAACPAAPLMPLTTDKEALKTAVGNMTEGGGTGGHIGIQWAWYLISPKWADYMPAGSAPAAYGADVRKFAIIMTDGEFNVAYEGVPKNDSQYNQAKKSMAKARKLCTNMKKKGIKIFTIGFALSERNARQLMKDCASPDTQDMTYFHEASGGNELKKVYSDIATSIKQLRLVR